MIKNLNLPADIPRQVLRFFGPEMLQTMFVCVSLVLSCYSLQKNHETNIIMDEIYDDVPDVVPFWESLDNPSVCT